MKAIDFLNQRITIKEIKESSKSLNAKQNQLQIMHPTK